MVSDERIAAIMTDTSVFIGRVRRLHTEAAAAGDEEQVRLCLAAIAGDEAAREKCAIALAEGEG